MSHSSPTVLLIWTVLTTLLGAFLFSHLWAFDRFKCLRWNQGSQGAFKRVMTYSYLLSIPLIFTYSLGNCIIKYQEGYVDLPPFGIIPKPYELWSSSNKNAFLPLELCLSIAWGLEMVSHLEELCFWLFVVNAGPIQKEWFSSIYFKIWAGGSVAAVIYMPLTTIFTRSDTLKCEASTFFGGSLGSGLLTVAFFPVLWKFPPFLRGLRKDGVDMSTIVRLTKFHELNSIRVFFRLMFAVSLFILAADGIRPHRHINDTMIGADLLTITSGIGVVVSSGITLVIFFPRSIEGEIERETSHNRGIFSTHNRRNLTFISQEQELYGTYDVEMAPHRDQYKDKYEEEDEMSMAGSGMGANGWRSDSSMIIARPVPTLSPNPATADASASQFQKFRLEPNRLPPPDVIEEEPVGTNATSGTRLTAGNLRKHDNGRAVSRQISHFAETFRSPIDFRRPGGSM